MNFNKYTALILSCLMTFNFFTPVVMAEDIQKNSPTQKINISLTERAIPESVEKEMKDSIKKIYGSDNVDEIYSHIYFLAQKAKAQRPDYLVKDDLNRTSDWYKDEIIYMFYADQFGVRSTIKPNTFKDSIGMLDYLKDLGVTTIYILPFVDSPMCDAGFDIRNPRNVRADLGGLDEFKQFISAAREKGFKIKADLVLNHISDQHEWFKDALKGDLDKLHYFVVKEEMPEFTKYKDDKLGWVVEYKESDGSVSKRRLIFPEQTEHNYRQVTINNKNYYLYHTFYPFQLDMNWENPEVLYYNLETITFWANLGIDIFRMDAIPYLMKENGTNAENLPRTHETIKLLSLFLQSIAPRSVIQAEACQLPNKILPYFGKERTITETIDDKEKELTRTDEVQIAYHFPYMPAIWASLITSDNRYFWKAHKQTPEIPSTASWAIFLRVHDELTLEMVNKKTRELIYEDLEPKGAEFRKGFGVSGRMANFLDNDPDRISMAFSILMSLPGIPIIYYGDEIASQNNFYNARRFARLREIKEKNKTSKNGTELLSYFDSRDINRGAIRAKNFYNAQQDNKVYKRVKQLIKVRKENPVISRGTFTQVKTKSPEIFAYTRTYNDEKIIIINNLSNKKIKAEIELPTETIWTGDKDVLLTDLLNKRKLKVSISTTNKKMTLLLRPYDTAWLKIEN